MLKWPVGLGLLVARRFFQSFDAMPFGLDDLVEGAQRVFDTLNGASGIVGMLANVWLTLTILRITPYHSEMSVCRLQGAHLINIGF